MLTTKSWFFFLLGAFSCLEPLCSDFRPLRKNPPSAMAVGGQVIKKVKKLQVLSHYFNKSLQEVSLKPQENIAIPECRTLVVKVQGSCFLIVEESLDSSFSYEYVEDFQEQESLKALETSFLSSSLSPRKKTEKQAWQHASLKISGKTTDSPPSPLDVSYFYNKRRTSCTVLLREKNGPLGGVLSYFQGKKGSSTIILRLPKGKNLILQGDQVHCFLHHPKGKKIVLRMGEGSCKGQGYFSSWEIFGSKVHLELYGLKGFFKAHLTEGSLILGFQPLVYNSSAYRISSPTFSSPSEFPENNHSVEKNNHGGKSLFLEENKDEKKVLLSGEKSSEKKMPLSEESRDEKNSLPPAIAGGEKNSYSLKKQNYEQYAASPKEGKTSSSLSRCKRGTYCDLYVTPQVKGKLLFPQGSFLYFQEDSLKKTSVETPANSLNNQVVEDKERQKQENNNNYPKRKQKRKKTFGPYSVQIFSSGAKNIDLHYF